MSTAKTKAFWVGAFVFLGLTIAIAALIFLGVSDYFAKKKTYVTYFDSSVQGLNLDSPVKFRGISIGKVSGIEIAPDGHLVEVIMELPPDFPVADSLGATLGFTGITGMKYIDLDFAGPEKLEQHPELTFKPPYKVIYNVPGSMEEIEIALTTIYEKLMLIDTEGISHDAKSFFRSGTQMMNTADSVLNKPELTRWTVELENNLVRMENILSSIKTDQYHRQINEVLLILKESSNQLNQGAIHFNNTLASLEADLSHLNLTERADTLFSNMNLMVQSATDLVGQSNYSVAMVMQQLGVAISQLNSTMEQLNSLMITLEDYPSNIIYTAPPAKEK